MTTPELNEILEKLNSSADGFVLVINDDTAVTCFSNAEPETVIRVLAKLGKKLYENTVPSSNPNSRN